MTRLIPILLAVWLACAPVWGNTLNQQNDRPLLWAWALNAPLTESNGLSHDIYGGELLSAIVTQKYRGLLATWWSVNNQQEARQTIMALSNWQMATPVFVQQMTPYFAMTPEQLAAVTTDDPFLASVIKHREFLKTHSIKAWDLSRAQTVIAWSYLAGYLDAETARGAAIAVAMRTQMHFDSWEQLATSYLFGYWHWSRIKTG